MIRGMRRSAATLLSLLGLSAAAWAVYPFPDITKKFEFSLSGGFAAPRFKGATTYGDTWNYYFLTRVDERTTIDVVSKTAASVAAGIAYYFSPQFGVQLQAAYHDAPIETTSNFRFNWTWSPAVGNGNFSRTSEWFGAGDLRTIPVSLNFIARVGRGRFEASVAGGPSVFINTLTAETAFGYGFTKTNPPPPAPQVDQYVDALRVPLEFRERTWSRIGFNFSGGLVYKIPDTLGFSLEARYFFCPAKTLTWDFVAGQSDGLYFSGQFPILRNVPFTEDDAQGILDDFKMTGLSVNPSFFQVVAGFKIYFGN